MQMLQVLGLLSRYSLRLNSFTLVCLLQGCINQGAFVEGKIIHTYLVKTGAQHNVFLWTALADMYAKYGTMEEARKVFDAMPEHSLVTWNVMIAGYVKHGLIDRASLFFKKMLNEGIHPDAATMVSMMQACVAMRDIEWGRLLHFYAVDQSSDSNILLDNAMTDMYGKCGNLHDAYCLFQKMHRKDRVSWTAMLFGYALMGLNEQSFRCFYEMLQHEIMPDDSAFLCVLNVCASLGILDQGKAIHSVIVETASGLSIDVENSVVDMYGKCGCISGAFHVFRTMREQDSVSWNAMIGGLAQSGCCIEVVELVLEMEEDGVEVNTVTLLQSLYACSHAGLQDIGIFILIMMGRNCLVIASQDHHAGLIDMLGRAGNLDEAFNVVQISPFQPVPATWRSLLSACRIHNDKGKAQKAAEFLVGLEPQSDAGYLLLYNACRISDDD